MKDKFFLDTSILINAFDESDPVKRSRAEDLIQSAVREGTGCIRYQVAQESHKAFAKIGMSKANFWFALKITCNQFTTCIKH